MAEKPVVILIEDTPSLSMLYEQYLSDEDVDVRVAETGAKGLELIRQHPPAVLLLDIELPDMNGLEILRYMKSEQHPGAVVVITAHGSVNVAVEAMRAGAYDFIVKPFNANRLRVTVNNALERHKLSQLVETIQAGARSGYEGFIGRSLAMQAVYRIIDSASKSKATVFITGESGTGKEVCAQAIHKQSERKNGPFVAINCGAIPRELMESEIFGHKKGAFTGAVADRDGAASQAHQGTLFLDEIGEMPMDLQTKLLRFIQTGTFQKVGGSRLEKVDVRFVCATNRDVLAEVERGNFREDLYYRLHVIPIAMPPLRDRDEDVLEIAQSYLEEYAREEERQFIGFAPDVQAMIQAYSWPGNVRELQNIIRNVVVLNDGKRVTSDMLPAPLSRIVPEQGREIPQPTTSPMLPQPGFSRNSGSFHATPPPVPPADSRLATPATNSSDGKPKPLWQIEKEAIEAAIAQCGGNIPKAAEMLEIAPSTIYRKKASWEKQEKSATPVFTDSPWPR
ncbi:sigma-54-dependent transcriptional regulator [Aestuariispira insulae]|uniref:DNA-binding NtrC family response regulator n=1 Tax=Aestuariispira insulae TaxID=1461337 RepID=A0A3D9HI08_9PROT|nr:sigma-54 dependent transcriptional regulator [Aestuariispira insulae]RED49127.1 DNA-binding NtrC family response regulator [Aestuariispira insulae]